MRRSAETLGLSLVDVENHRVILKDDPCSSEATTKRYAGWSLLGLIGGAVIGAVAFPKHPIVASLAGLTAGLAVASKSDMDQCVLRA